ncbi:calponin homology domain-containing protein [Chytridium lagenaria]|nr:calponin homology domain-containing protein [Chytridium lagenaria]
MAKANLLQWCQQILYPYVEVGILPKITDFSRSWQNGVAFLALVHTFNSNLVPDLSDLFLRLNRTRKGPLESAAILGVSTQETASASRYVYTSSKSEWMQTLSRAFSLAELKMRISRLLDPEDLVDMEPDEKSVMLYISEFRRALSGSALVTVDQISQPIRRSSVTEHSAVNQLQTAISSYLTDSNKMATWLNRQQQSLHRFTRSLCSEKDAQPSLSHLSSWCQRIMDVLFDETSSSADIGRIISKEVSDIEGS